MDPNNPKKFKLTCAIQSMLKKSSSKSTPSMSSILERKSTLRRYQPLLFPNSKNSNEDSSSAKCQSSEDDEEDEESPIPEIPRSKQIPGYKYTVYTAPRRFLPGAKLHPFLASKQPDMIQMDKMEYTLLVVLSAMRQVISSEKLFDTRNTTVLKLSPEFVEALDMPWCHVTEVRDLTLQQMELVDPALESEIAPPTTDKPATLDTLPANFNPEANYWIKPRLLQVFRSLESCPKEKVVFSYKEATSFLSEYILIHQNQFFDTRNVKIANIRDSLLSLAFGVELFHRTQVTALLRKQLILYDPNPSNWPHDIFNYIGYQGSKQHLDGIFKQIPNDSNNPKTRVIMDLASKDENLFIKFEGYDILKLLELGVEIHNMPITQEFIKKEQIQALIRLEASKKQVEQIENQKESNSESSQNNQVESKKENSSPQAKLSSIKETMSNKKSSIESLIEATKRLESKMDLYECRNRIMIKKVFEMKQNADDDLESKETIDFTNLENEVSNLEKQMKELQKCFNNDEK